MADKQNRENAQQTFRQFAWNLAGTLADKKTGAAKARPGRVGAVRTGGAKR
ncbi:hypothetical protein DEVEQU_03870 [Devosia equisanguinis]|uniref:Uncharacterized protein n=1 Tax=Devosia equisanguinis TaxID=2490941 RepID=A0A447IGV5_9HYPH|nr:hypothetical protein [Devosia equisanguinis]VDS06705.1 hypothetical protein DEVEQU_03870 [Devosia equisanguinis]